MPGLNLKQITDKLNAEFEGSTARKLVFWYDEKAEFIEDVETLELVNAKLYHLKKDNQFYTKHFLERVDTTTNYLIYAPFPRPHVRDNHLEDLLLYSRQFFADLASLVMMDLGIDPRYKPILEKHIKFFRAKDRTRRFYALQVDDYTKETIEVALMSSLCKARVATFDEVVRVVLTEGDLGNNGFLEDFQAYDLLDAFWRLCKEQFGYADAEPTLKGLVIMMFVTYTVHCLRGDCPPAWKGFVSYKPGNITVFLSSLMNHKQYGEKYDSLSVFVAKQLRLEKLLETYEPEALVKCDTFEIIDHIIISWATGRLLLKDTGAKLDNLSIPNICEERRKSHFGERYRFAYRTLYNAYYVVAAAEYQGAGGFAGVAKRYIETDYKIDQHYRGFYYSYDRLNDASQFEELRVLVENIYTNRYLEKCLYSWDQALRIGGLSPLPPQRSFYSRYVEPRKGRVVVIISDALRFEVGQSLFTMLDNDEKCAPKLEAMLSMLPSITRLGMGALLPHKTLQLIDDHRVLVDDRPSDLTKQREAILNLHVHKSRCVQFDKFQLMDRAGLREVFTGMEVVYVYHNQIDTRGDKQSTENEVFTACREAVEEIFAFIKRVSTSANTYHFIVTADHGFIYKRDKLQESDKITHDLEDGYADVNRRFIVSEEPVKGDGVRSIPLGKILDNDDAGHLTVPIGSHVFKVAGGGQNFVHGGASPQEMIIPVIDVKVERGRAETKPARIALVSMVQKITSLILSLDFIQTEPVSDVVKKTRYRVFFVSEDDEQISNECICIADKRESDPGKRIFKLRFNFKNKRYDKSKRYYLVAHDEDNKIEVLRHGVVMDIAFADDFGFNVDR